MKTIRGLLTEFDLVACEEVTNRQGRLTAHQIFLTSLAVGIQHAGEIFRECRTGDEIDMTQLNQMIQKAMSEIKACSDEIVF